MNVLRHPTTAKQDGKWSSWQNSALQSRIRVVLCAVREVASGNEVSIALQIRLQDLV